VEVKAEAFNIADPAKPSIPARNVFDLSPEAQAEFLKVLGKKTGDTALAPFLNAIRGKLSDNAEAPKKIRVFPLTINKSIVFSVDRKWVSEGYDPDHRIINRTADRLANLEMTVSLPDGKNFIFNSWNNFVTDRVAVDLGKVTSSQQWSATANVSGTITGKLTEGNKLSNSSNVATKTGKADIGQQESSGSNTAGDETTTGKERSTSIGPSASLNFVDKYETSINLLLSRIKLSGTLSSQAMTLRQEGAFDTDLSGNTSIAVEYAYQGAYAAPIYVLKIAKYYNEEVAIPTADLKKSRIMWLFPNFSETIEGTIQYKYLYRYVRKGSKKHLPEARQRVYNFYGEVGYGQKDDDGYIAPLKIALVKPEDMKPATYRIYNGANPAVPIQVDNAIAEFETAQEAAAFLEYLNSISKTTNLFTNITDLPADNNISLARIIKHQH
jgi:hypothetical protein